MKKMIFGFVLGAIIFSSATVYAGVTTNLLEVFYNVKDIKLNGSSKMPTQKPFISEGTTYVPLRYVSEALGQQVLWDDQSQTVNINDCMHNQRDDSQIFKNFICVTNRYVSLPDGVSNEGLLLNIELLNGPLEVDTSWLLPFVLVKKGNSSMSISMPTGIVMGEIIDPNDKNPFDFMKPYITGYFPK